MELELNTTHLNCYDTVLDTTLFHEETLETIVPDACPDILRIVDCEAMVCLKGKEAQEGRAEISGSVRAAVLYLPDGAEGVLLCGGPGHPCRLSGDGNAAGPLGRRPES